MNQTIFDYVTSVVIDKLEGGYFHPNMRTKNPQKFGAYHRSGETMFGFDRHAGHDLFYSSKRKTSDVLQNLKHIEANEYKYKTPEAEKFWTIIDKADAKNKWQWLYRGGDKYSELKSLTGRIMYPQYEKLVKLYLTPESRQIVESDPKLLLHFIYACWNGTGWFRKFAEKFNKAVAAGERDKGKLLELALDSRINSGNKLIKQSGEKIKAFIYDFKIPDYILKKSKKEEGGKWIEPIIVSLFLVSLYVIYKTYKTT